MNERHSVRPFAYMYLDHDGIDSLYSQTVDRLEVELVQSQERGSAGRLTAKLGIGALLKQLTEIGTDAEVSIAGKQIRETKTKFRSEQKLSALVRVLSRSGNGVLFTDLASAAIVCADTSSIVYVQVFEKFNLPQFYCGSGVDEVNRDKGVDFEIGPMSRRGDSYDHSDRYFKKKHYHFFMFAGIGKFPRLTGEGMGRFSHEAFLFRAYQGKDVPLGVFGYLKHLTGLEYQIKPFAIWV